MKWQGHFCDDKNDTLVEIENCFSEANAAEALKMVIDGVTFCGMAFDDWALGNLGQLHTAQKRFHLLKWGSKQDGYQYDLLRYRLRVCIPTTVIIMESQKEQAAEIAFSYQLRPFEQGKDCQSQYYCEDEQVFRDVCQCHYFQLTVGEEVFAAEEPTLDFETSLKQICRKIWGKYLLKNCFGCLYSDYSPLGNDNFGSMLCYQTVGNDYLQVVGKYGDEYGGKSIWEVYEQGKQRQETDLCPYFQPRIKTKGGYRGLIY